MYNYKLIFLFLLIYTALYYHYYLNETHYYTYYINRVNKKNPKVYDIGHKYLPNIEQYEYLINLIGLFIIYWLFYNVSFIVEFIILIILIYIIRIFTIQLTVLPKMKNCSYNNFTLNGFCYDKIFSGHVAFLFLFTLFLFHYKNISLLSLIFINGLYGLLIIATRAHYTIDVIVSLLVSFIIFQNRSHIFKLFKNK